MEGIERVIKEREARKKLNSLLRNVETYGDINNIQSLIDDYIEEGYNVRSYISKCNAAARKFSEKR